MIFGRANATPPERPANAANLLGALLLVVDGSEPSMAAARFAMDLAKQLQSHVTAVYVVDTATMDYLTQMRIFVAEERAEFEADIERTGQRYLEYVSTIGRKQGVETKTLLRKSTRSSSRKPAAWRSMPSSWAAGGARPPARTPPASSASSSSTWPACR